MGQNQYVNDRLDHIQCLVEEAVKQQKKSKKQRRASSYSSSSSSGSRRRRKGDRKRRGKNPRRTGAAAMTIAKGRLAALALLKKSAKNCWNYGGRQKSDALGMKLWQRWVPSQKTCLTRRFSRPRPIESLLQKLASLCRLLTTRQDPGKKLQSNFLARSCRATFFPGPTCCQEFVAPTPAQR